MTEWWKAKKLERVECSNVLRLCIGKALKVKPLVRRHFGGVGTEAKTKSVECGAIQIPDVKSTRRSKNSKRGVAIGEAKYQPDGAHLHEEQGLEVEVDECGSSFASEQTSSNNKGAAPLDERGKASWSEQTPERLGS